jgi:hypothetical protein
MKTWDRLSSVERIERWENVLRVLRAMTPHERRKHFKMDTWGDKTECGTIACAAGRCGLDPYFRKRGFKLDFTYDKDFDEWDADLRDVGEFFGFNGSSEIFFDGTIRTVGTVAREVIEYIKFLKVDNLEENFILKRNLFPKP